MGIDGLERLLVRVTGQDAGLGVWVGRRVVGHSGFFNAETQKSQRAKEERTGDLETGG